MENHNVNECNIKYEKLKLHVKYIAGISLGIVGIIIVAACYSKNGFVGQVSFAGTISSIILSVIAIFMTIIGETKSDNTKDKLVNVSEKLEFITKSINDATNKLEDTINSNTQLYSGMHNFENKIEDIISSKSLITSEEYVAAADNNNEDEYNCYIKVFKNASIYLREEFYRDLSLVLLYIAVKKKCGLEEIAYQEFVSDSEKLQIQFDDSSLAWNAAFIFAKVSWENDEFNNYVYNTIENKYFYEVDKITSLYKDKNKKSS